MSKKAWLLLVLCLFLILAGTALVAAEETGGFSIPWWTVDAGGGTSTGGPYTLTGTIGQPDASLCASGGDFAIQSGFWGGCPTTNTYLPLIAR
ncbi:MAG: hypothetical protein HUU38_25015 [Anaerolineales bacterium]|nr:hypothetical protein [Anaerolineales bacterium]